MQVLLVNAGSSSLKLSVLDGEDRRVGARELPALAGPSAAAALRAALAELPRADAVGHRVVHGGDRFTTATVVTPGVAAALRDLIDLAPLHQPKSLAALEAVTRALPGLPAVACFDTAFHATLPPAAATYALPAAWRRRWPLRRFGFHGLSHAYAAREAAARLGRPPREVSLVTCHLGAGASLAAVRAGASVDTTMGFTPLEGLVMATRSGSVDPGLLLWLLERGGLAPRELGEALERESGLAGLAGTPDMRAVLAGAQRGEEAARLALDVYVHRLRAGIGAMAAALDRVDAVVFTGGVGERAPAVREAAMDGLAPAGGAPALVVEAREDLEMARQVRAALRDRSAPPG